MEWLVYEVEGRLKNLKFTEELSFYSFRLLRRAWNACALVLKLIHKRAMIRTSA